MSYDLYFYKKKNSPLTEEKVIEYLNKNFPFNTSDNDSQWDYENPEIKMLFKVRDHKFILY